MILYSYECRKCGNITDQYFNMNDTHPDLQCGKCGGVSRQVIGIPGPNLASESSPWIRTVLEIVDKEGGQHCQEFLKDPTRTNYERWKKFEGVRHMEAGEKPGRPEHKEITTEMLMKQKRKREAITLRR